MYPSVFRSGTGFAFSCSELEGKEKVFGSHLHFHTWKARSLACDSRHTAVAVAARMATLCGSRVLRACGHGDEPHLQQVMTAAEEELANVQWLGFCHLQWGNTCETCSLTSQMCHCYGLGSVCPKPSPQNTERRRSIMGLIEVTQTRLSTTAETAEV